MPRLSLKLLQITCATVWCLFSSGIIFGFAAFKIILIKENVYSDYCLPNLTQSNDVCIEQDLKLNDMFAISVALTNLMAFPVGFILDKKGPRVCGVIGSILLALGSTSFIMAKQWYPVIDCYLIGYAMLAMGGPFVFISCFQLANCFPKRSGTILGLLTGCFDASSALFWFYRIIYQKVIVGLSLRKFFTIYMVVPAFILFCQCQFMPRDTYKNSGTVAKLAEEGLDENGQLLEGDDGWNITSDDVERMSLLNENEIQRHANNYETNDTRTDSLLRRKSVLETYVERKLKRKSGGVFGVLHDIDTWTQLKSPWFYLMLIFSATVMVRINYFIATIRSQETYLLGDIDTAIVINKLFDVLLPIGGLIAIPFIGIMLDNLTTLTVIIILSILSVTIGILGLIPNSFYSNLLGILLLVVFRPFYYTVLSDYCSKVFGFETFGTVYGLLMCLCGLFNLSQRLFDKWTHTTFSMNPTPINSVLVTMTIITSLVLITYIKRQLQKTNEVLI